MSKPSSKAVVDGSTDKINGLDETDDQNEIMSDETSVGSLTALHIAKSRINSALTNVTENN